MMTPASHPSDARHFEAKLYRILAGLAQRGLVATPSEALELVHEFITPERVQAVKRSYRDVKGPLEAYVAKAFARFAARRLAQSRRHRMLELDESLALAPQTDAPEIDVEAFAAALQMLPDERRALLDEVLYAPAFSLAATARRRGSTSHLVRQQILEALAMVITRTQRPDGISRADWEVAQALWGEELTAEEVAQRLRRSRSEVRGARSRLLAAVARGLDAIGFRRGTLMPRPDARSTRQVFLDALRKEGDPAALDALRQHAGALRELLDPEPVEEEATQLAEADALAAKCRPEWLARVYAAIGGGEDLVEADWPYRSKLEQVGDAFESVLLVGLPVELESLQAFAALPAAEARVREHAAAHPAAAELSEAVRAPLARVGLTPLSFLHGADAIGDTFDRYLDYGIIPATDELHVQRGVAGLALPGILEREQLTQEIALRAECSAETAATMHAWLAAVAGFKPYLFTGFECRDTGDELVLVRRAHVDERELLDEWQSAVAGRDEYAPVESVLSELEALPIEHTWEAIGSAMVAALHCRGVMVGRAAAAHGFTLGRTR